MENINVSKIYLIFFILLFFNCIGTVKNINDVELIVYRFKDASVSHVYHRSYTISISESEINITVDVYEDIIAEKDYSITSENYSKIINVIADAKISNKSASEGDGCDGGKSEYLTLYKDQEVIYSGSVYHCGGKDYGNLSGNISAVSDALVSLIPDFDILLSTEYLK